MTRLLLWAAAVLTAASTLTHSTYGQATWYGGSLFHGRPMANTELYNQWDPTTTAANRWPLGTRLRVTRPTSRGDRAITVTVRDRGLFQHELDLSLAAFAALADPDEGRIEVWIQEVE